MDENDESLVFVTIWNCRTHVPLTSRTSSVMRTDLDFKISVALFHVISDEGIQRSLTMSTEYEGAAEPELKHVYHNDSKNFDIQVWANSGS